MRVVMRGVAVGAAMVWASAASAQSDLHCDRDVIVQLAEQVLQDRNEAGRFRVRRVGGMAAYLLMHYDGLSEAEMLALLADLAQAEDRQDLSDAREMALALAVSTYGVESSLRFYGAGPEVETVRAGKHLQRAIVLADAGETFFRLLAAARSDPAIEVDPAWIQGLLQRFGLLFIDQDDATLLQISESAEAAGEIGAAAIVASNMSDLSRMTALIEAYRGDPEFGRMMDPVWLETVGGVWRTQPRPLRPDPTAEQVFLFEIVRADTLNGAAAFLGIMTNQSGQTEPIGRVAREFIAAVEAGHLRPHAQPEEGWLFLYRGLVREMGQVETRRILSTFNWPSTDVLHFGDLGHVTIDWLLTFHALGPAMKGAAFPPRPSLLGSEAPWETFAPFVAALAEGRDVLPRTEEERLLGFELLWRSGRHQAAIDWAGEYFEPPKRIAALRDVMRRMDGNCDAVLAFPGYGFYLAGQPLYRFPPEPYMQ